MRFISAEPLLGSLFSVGGDYEERRATRRALHRDDYMNAGRAPLDLTGIDWLIAGGESGGREARPMHPEWARELRDACLAGDWRCECGDLNRGHEWSCYRCGSAKPDDAPPAFFFKQWGSHNADGIYCGASPKSGGRILDGRTWDEMPAAQAVTA